MYHQNVSRNHTIKDKHGMSETLTSEFKKWKKRKTEETDQHIWFTHRLILTSENINKIISVYNSSTHPEHIFIFAFLYFVWYFYVQQQIFEEEKLLILLSDVFPSLSFRFSVESVSQKEVLEDFSKNTRDRMWWLNCRFFASFKFNNNRIFSWENNNNGK